MVNAEMLKTISFFEPEATKEAFEHFEKYVNTKWPLRVYAIEPVIAQQNVADGFGRRTQSAFDLAGSAPVAPLKLLADSRRPGWPRSGVRSRTRRPSA